MDLTKNIFNKRRS